MRNFQQKKSWRRLVESWPVLILLGLLLLFFAWGIIGLFRKMQMTMENREIAAEQLAELEEKKETFSKEVYKLQTESGVEESIRERFPVVKEGEGLIVVVDDTSTAETPEEDSHGFFSFFKNLFR